jgi:hyperosmotically inducible protein
MRTLTNILLGTLVGGGLAFAVPSNPPTPDADIAHKVTHEIRMYPRYTIFDDIKFRVENGNVELTGEVNQPYKKSDLQRIVAYIPGVVTVTNDLKVLPLSNMDNQLRIQVARAIYRDPVLSRYSMGTLPPIHIIVDSGRVTLEGVVSTQTDKNIAGLRAGSVGLSFGPVVNNLVVENPKHVS